MIGPLPQRTGETHRSTDGRVVVAADSGAGRPLHRRQLAKPIGPPMAAWIQSRMERRIERRSCQ
jgi:hypothetical protein